jgi:hypothetical protein
LNALDDEVYASAALERNLSKLTGWQREWQIGELQLYRLARQALEGPPLADDLSFLTQAKVPGNTWATFMRMSEAWARRPRSSKKLESQLPRIYGIEGFEEDVDPHADELVDSPAERSEGEVSHLSEVLNRFVTDVTASQKSTDQMLKDLQSQVARLQSVNRRQRLLTYVVIGGLVWILAILL